MAASHGMTDSKKETEMKKEDKDEIIKHLLETLDEVEKMVGETDPSSVKDYIWKRKAEVTF